MVRYERDQADIELSFGNWHCRGRLIGRFSLRVVMVVGEEGRSAAKQGL